MDAAISRKPRVLMIVHDLPVPYDRRTWSEARTLASAGFAVSIICPKDDTCSASFERRDGIDVYRYPLPFEARRSVGYAAEMVWCFLMSALLSVRVRLTSGFDIIHTSNPPDTYWLLALAWRPFGTRFIFDHHDLSPEMYLAKFQRAAPVLHRILLWLERMSFRTADVTIATNESYRQVACTRGGRSPDSVFVVRSGPNGSGFRTRPAEPALKQGHRFLCCYLGKMCEQDGVDYLLRSVAILTGQRGRSDILFVIIGAGPALPELRRLAVQLSITDHCRFTGYLPDEEVSRWLSTADLGIDPDPRNSWSDRSTMNKVLDYMFFGCPVVGFDLAENRYSAGDAGLFVTPNSEVALADAIEALLADEERRRRMGASGSGRVRAELLWQHSEPKLLAAYAQLCAARVG